MAENYKLSLTAEEIDQRLANALLATEQTLTEAQKQQARTNIGVAEATVVDFDALGLTDCVMALFAENGGKMNLLAGNDYGVDIEQVAAAFPKDRPYIARLTSGENVLMSVDPVYSTFGTTGRFQVAHFDSYLMQDDQTLTKFYVRIGCTWAVGPSSATVNGINVYVGFYS